ALLFACGGDSTNNTTNTAGTAMKEMNAALDNISNLSPGGQVTNGKLNGRVLSTASDEWSGTGELSDPRQSGELDCPYTDQITPQRFIQIDFTADATRCNGSDVNVFGRVRSAMSHICGILLALTATSSADLPTSGEQSVTFDDTLRTEFAEDCGI